VFGQLKHRHAKWILWLLALVLLCFLVSLHPDLRRLLWWSGEETPGSEEG
jgi:hypothetical protein